MRGSPSSVAMDINASKGIALARTANIRFPAQRTRRQLMYRRFSVTVLFFSA